MKALTTILLALLILGCTSASLPLEAKKVKDWVTESTLWCEQIELTIENPVQRAQAEYWIQNDNKPKECILREMCGKEPNSICGTCYEETKFFEAKFDDINQLSSMSGGRNLSTNTAYKIQFSNKAKRTRIMGFKTEYLLDINDWEFYPISGITIYDFAYSWDESGLLKSPIDVSVSRESLILDKTIWAKDYLGVLEKRKYQCKLIEEKKIDSAISSFKENQKIYQEKRRKETLLKRLEQEKKNKI